ncbi:hypothetical protein [Brytella acorum]|uniref:hypothetical protein n=1 Tax=Brytella acorum TaxID=2959299 RepID=UPI0037430948
MTHHPVPSTRLPPSDALETERVELRNRLLERLPDAMQRPLTWLLVPRHRWVRIPAGLLLILGGCLSFLPVLGLWMLPLGILLLAEDIPPLRRASHRMLQWIQRKHPAWMGPPHKEPVQKT